MPSYHIWETGPFDRIKFALKFRDHQREPRAQCGIDHRRRQAFGAGDFGKGHINVSHDFHSRR